MDCKIISTERSQRGATIAETVIALAIAAIIAVVMAALTVHHARSLVALTNWIDMDQANRLAIDDMSRTIRQANRVTGFATNAVTLEDADGTPLSFAYDAGTRTVTRTKGGESTVLLQEVDAFTFSMMQRNIIPGSYNNYPTSDLDECKILAVYWNCSRTILGRKASVSGGQSTRIVIRRQ